tara:strand:+ start:12006 stop:12353 length:348 start_codon:yes stop_codon:yes gene_type:complete
MKTTALDFDAVLNTYKGWEGPNVEYPPRAGVEDFLIELQRHRRIVIYSCRPIRNVRAWLKKHRLSKYIDRVETRKPLASEYVDDRAIQFRGDYRSTLEAILTFGPYWDPAKRHET